jgi:hypothetical protein
VSGGVEHGKVPVVGDDPVRLGRDGTVCKLVIVGIRAYQPPAESRLDVSYVVVELAGGLNDVGEVPPLGDASKSGDDFFVFQPNRRAYRQRKPALGHCPYDGEVWMPCDSYRWV